MKPEVCYETFCNILKSMSDNSTDNIRKNDELIEIGINSIKLIQCVVLFEQEYGIVFRDEDLINESFVTVKDVYNYIQRAVDNG